MVLFLVYVHTNEQFWDTFPWQDFLPDISLTVNIIPDISLTCFKFPDMPGFPDKWSPWI